MIMLERPATEAEIRSDDDITHYYCCDENRSRCGLDITDEIETTGQPDRECEECVSWLGEPCGALHCPNLPGRSS